MRPEARTPGETPTRPEPEERLQEPEEVLALPCGDERTVVAAILVGLAGGVNPWIGLVGDVDVGVPLRVLQVDVVLRLVLLDQGVLEDERLNLGVGDDEVD